ncbi:retrovirus-related pol polyprotein from transposon TNT 1-94 [Tanacetum coccineum]|uniref:Retrovirus-related pol polyprotein from transposon TNT 1-94 n=1 Tax=Tanacetum coccineum TaxID=301880 RepID=A0ABQ5HV57_9ASTR
MTSSNNQMKNDIMAVGSRECLPMLTQEALIDAEAEVVHMILNGIGNDIYSTVDACPNAKEMWIAIERLQQGESFNMQDVKTKLLWEFEWSRFITIVKQANNLDDVSYHKLFDIMKQHQNKVNEIQAERIARNANPLVLVAATRHYPDTYPQAPPAPQPYKTHAPSSRQTTSTISHATTRNKGKEIFKAPSPPFESAPEEHNDEEEAQRDKKIQKSLALIAKQLKNIYKPTNNNLIISSNTKNKNVDTSPRTMNDKQTGQFGNQRTMTVAKNKEVIGNQRVKDYEYHKQKMLLCKKEAACIKLSAEQSEWLSDTNDERDEQELEAYYMYMIKIQEVLTTVDENFGPTYDAKPLEKGVDLDAEEPEDERVLLASFIANLKLNMEKVELERNKTFQTNQKEKEEDELKCKEALDLLAYVQANVDNITSIVETDWKQHELDMQTPIKHHIKLLVHDLLIQLAHKALKTVGIFENALKEVILEDLKYVKSVEKEADDLKMEIDDLKSQLETEKIDVLKVDDLLLQEFFSKDFVCFILLSIDDIDEYSEMICKYLEKIKECERLKIELSKSHQQKHDKSFAQLEQHCVNLELALQNAKEKTFVPKTNEDKDLSKPVTPQILPRKEKVKQVERNTNDPRVSNSTRVAYNTSVSKQQLSSTQMKDKVMQYNSQVMLKKKEVEYHHRYGAVRNDQFAPILGYGDLVQGNVTIKRESTCFVRDLQGNDLLTGTRGFYLYTIGLHECSSPTPICFMAKASTTQAWLWHRRLSHLNFDTINRLSKNDIVNGLQKLKFIKDHLCSSCELNLLHMDLCGTMRVQSINRKKYILVIIDDYSRGTEFFNKTLQTYFQEEGIRYQMTIGRTPEQNGVVERQKPTLIEVAQTMLLAYKFPLFFWAEAIETACYTQNRSLIIPRRVKTPYLIINERKATLKFLHIFCCTCYISRYGENLNKIKEKEDPCIFVGYATQSKGYRAYNKRTILIIESIHINFDELKEVMTSDDNTLGLVPQ